MAEVTSGSVTTTACNGLYATLSWTSTSSNNVSTISYTVSTGGTKYHNVYSSIFKISCAKGKSSASEITVLDYDNDRVIGPNKTLKTGTFTITHDSSAQANFTIQLLIYITKPSTGYTGSGTWDLPTLATACGAPSNLKSTSGVTGMTNLVAKGGSYTLTWNAGTAGTSNTIKGYTIYYRICPDWSSRDDYKPSKTNFDGKIYQAGTAVKYTGTIPTSIERGNLLIFGVVTNGSAGLDSDIYTTIDAYEAINSLPEAPSFVDSIPNIPSADDATAIISLRPGADANSTQDGGNAMLQIAYAYNSTDASKTLSGGGYRHSDTVSIAVSKAGTYYFWTYDGLEYSASYLECEVKKNAKPEISFVSCETTTYSALGDDEERWVSDIIPTIHIKDTDGINGYVTVTPYFYADDDYVAGTSFPKISCIGKDEEGNSTTEQDFELGNFNMTSAILNNVPSGYDKNLNSNDIQWTLGFNFNDGSEDSGEVRMGSFYECARAPKPGEVNKYNTQNFDNITSTISGQLWQEGSFEFPEDTSVEDIAITCTGNNNRSIGVSVTKDGAGGGLRKIAFKLRDNPASGEILNFIIHLLDSSGVVMKSIKGLTMQETLKPTVSDLTFLNESQSITSVKPYTASGTGTGYISWPFGTETDFTTALVNYNCSAAGMSLLARKDNYLDYSLTSNTWAISDKKLAITVPLDGMYPFDSNPFDSTFSGQIEYTMVAQITNLFGESFSCSLAQEFDFDEAPFDININGVDWYNEETAEWKAFTTEQLSTYALGVREGLQVRVGFSYKAYTPKTYTQSLIIGAVEGETSEYVLTKEEVSKEAVEVTGQYLILTVPAVNETGRNKTVIKIDGSSCRDELSQTYSIYFYKQVAPTFSFTDADLTDSDSSSYTIKYTYTVPKDSETGMSSDGYLTYYLCDEENSRNNLSNDKLTDTGSGSLKINNTITWKSRKISIHIVSTLNSTEANGPVAGISRDYYSNIQVVYNLVPTVAYRNNYLGINTKSPATGAIIDINEDEGKLHKYVLLQGFDNNGAATKCEIDITTGLLSFYVSDELTHSIDLIYGELT